MYAPALFLCALAFLAQATSELEKRLIFTVVGAPFSQLPSAKHSHKPAPGIVVKTVTTTVVAKMHTTIPATTVVEYEFATATTTRHPNTHTVHKFLDAAWETFPEDVNGLTRMPTSCPSPEPSSTPT